MSWFTEAFVDPVLRYGFMRDGLVVAVIVGVTSAVLSCLLVVRRQSLLGDAIAHSVLLGVAVGWIAAGTFGVFWGALASGVLAGVAITFLERSSRVQLDAAMGVVFTTAFALGLLIISRVRPGGIDLFHVLFGNVIGVTRADVWLTAASGLLVVGVVVALFRDFHVWSLDPEQARVLGVPTRALEYLFTALLSAAIVASLQAVGIVLVIAMLVIPGATALLLAERLATMMRVAALCGVVAATGGLYGSYHVDVASGPAIVLVAATLFAVAFVAAPRRGLVPRALRRRASVRRSRAEDVLKSLVKQQRGDPFSRTDGPVDRGALTWLRRRGLVARGDGVALTPAGEELAARLVYAHRTLETYLHVAEGYRIDEVDRAADRLEHELPLSDIDDMSGMLGRPDADPHGHPIPYEAADDLGAIAGHPLADAVPGRPGRVVMVSDDREDLLRRMVELGIVPRAPVTLVGGDEQALHVRIDGRDARLDRELGSRIYVREEG